MTPVVKDPNAKSRLNPTDAVCAAYGPPSFRKKGGSLLIGERATAQPGATEDLIEIKAVALNPFYQYPCDFGIPESEAVIVLPDALSFEKGAIFLLAVMTALAACTSIDILLETKYTPQDRQAVLIWGGASSVRTFAIQSTKSLGFTVYATASAKHHSWLKKLGTHAVFDDKASDVVAQILDAVKKYGANMHTAHCVVSGSLQPTLDVLKETKGDAFAKVAHSPVLRPRPPNAQHDPDGI
ncbi:hypothetical protein DV737_g2885, partial [Chaetothyriales sp. CBS 132003]